MEENRRQAYLHALGIECFTPVGRISQIQNEPDIRGPRLGVEINVEQRKTQNALQETKQKTKQKTVQKTEHKNEGKVPGKNKESGSTGNPVAGSHNLQQSPPDIEQRQTESDETSQDFRFTLQFYSINEKVAVINEPPYFDKGNWEERSRSLLLAILAALDLELTEVSDPLLFSWPLQEGEEVRRGSRQEAILALSGFMSKRFEASKYSHILAFTGQSGEFLADDNIAARVFADTSAQIIITQSLQAMLQVPALKKSVWEEIRHLKGCLTIEPQVL